MPRAARLALVTAPLALALGLTGMALAASGSGPSVASAAAPGVQSAPVSDPPDGAELVVAPGGDLHLLLTSCRDCGAGWTVTRGPDRSVATLSASTYSNPSCTAPCTGGVGREDFTLHGAHGGRTTVVLTYGRSFAPDTLQPHTYRVVVPQTLSACVARGAGTLYRTTSGTPRCARGDGLIGVDTATVVPAPPAPALPRAYALVDPSGGLDTAAPLRGVTRTFALTDGTCVVLAGGDAAHLPVLVTPTGTADVVLRVVPGCAAAGASAPPSSAAPTAPSPTASSSTGPASAEPGPGSTSLTVVAHNLTGAPVRTGFSLLVP